MWAIKIQRKNIKISNTKYPHFFPTGTSIVKHHGVEIPSLQAQSSCPLCYSHGLYTWLLEQVVGYSNTTWLLNNDVHTPHCTLSRSFHGIRTSLGEPFILAQPPLPQKCLKFWTGKILVACSCQLVKNRSFHEWFSWILRAPCSHILDACAWWFPHSGCTGSRLLVVSTLGAGFWNLGLGLAALYAFWVHPALPASVMWVSSSCEFEPFIILESTTHIDKVLTEIQC